MEPATFTNNKTVIERIVDTLRDQPSYEPEFHTLAETSDLVEDLGFDSLDRVGFMMALEKEFNILITDRELEGINTIANIEKLVKSKLALA